MFGVRSSLAAALGVMASAAVGTVALATDRSESAGALPSVAPAAVLPTAVTSEHQAVFSAFRRPAEALVSSAVTRHLDAPQMQARFAPNTRLARAVSAPRNEPDSTWHLVPGDDSVCLIAGAATCVPLDRAAVEGISLVRFDKPEGKAVPGSVPKYGRHTVLGVLPSGVDGVTAVTGTGDEFRASVTGETYAIEIPDGLVSSLRFTLADGTIHTSRLGA